MIVFIRHLSLNSDQSYLSLISYQFYSSQFSNVNEKETDINREETDIQHQQELLVVVTTSAGTTSSDN